MALPFTDAFTGAAAVLANPPYTQMALPSTTATLNRDGSGNCKASAVDSTNDIVAFDNSNTYNNDQYAQVTIISGIASGSHYAAVWVRCSGTGTGAAGYQFYTDGASGAGHTGIAKWVAGTQTVLKDIATTFTANDIMKIAVVSDTITAYKNGASVDSVAGGGAVASGAAGLSVYNSVNNDVTLDTFEGGNTSSATGKFRNFYAESSAFYGAQ